MMRKIAAVSLAALMLAACGGGGDNGAATEPATETGTVAEVAPAAEAESTTPPGPDAFVEWARTASLGTKDLEAATPDQLLGVGNSMCAVLSSSASYGVAIQDAVNGIDPDAGITTTEMEAWMRASVANLCPQHKDMLP